MTQVDPTAIPGGEFVSSGFNVTNTNAAQPNTFISGKKEGAILGNIPNQVLVPGTKKYVTDYVPPMWIENQGPKTRDPSRPFYGQNPNGSRNLGQVNFAGSEHDDWYRSGDEWLVAQQPESIPDLQDKLVAAGLLDPATVSHGLWSNPEANAMAVAMGQANVYGVPVNKMLDWMAAHPNTPTVQLSNAVDIGAVADSVIPGVIGRKLSKAEKNKLVNAWHKVQSDYAAQPPQVGGVEEAPPSLQAFAEGYAAEQNPGEVAQQASNDTFAKLRRSLGRI